MGASNGSGSESGTGGSLSMVLNALATRLRRKLCFLISRQQSSLLFVHPFVS